jgi:hypothetical protein
MGRNMTAAIWSSTKHVLAKTEVAKAAAEAVEVVAEAAVMAEVEVTAAAEIVGSLRNSGFAE